MTQQYVPERIVAERHWRKAYDATGPRRFDVTAKLTSLSGQTPYFSTTAEDRNMRRSGDNQIESCGCLHEEILFFFPELKPLVDIHLADENGVPSHAYANGIYWAGLSRWHDGKPMSPKDEYGRIPVETDRYGLEWSPTFFASHLRVDEDEAREIRGTLYDAIIERSAARDKAVREQILAQVCLAHDLPNRWQVQADAALAILQAV